MRGIEVPWNVIFFWHFWLLDLMAGRLWFPSTWAVASTPAQTNKLTKNMLHKLLWSNRLNLPTFGKHPQNSENIWKSNVKPKPDSRWRKTRQGETCGAPVLSLSTGDQWQQLPVATHGGNYATTIFNFWLHKNNNVNKVRTEIWKNWMAETAVTLCMYEIDKFG